MDNRILEIVFYLLDLYQESQGLTVDVTEASADLRNLGYSDDEISRAYSLISRRSQNGGETLYAEFPERLASTRLLTAEERHRLDRKAQSFLFKLTHIGVINPEQLELILETALSAIAGPVDVEEVKHITSGVLMDHGPDEEAVVNFDPDSSERLH